MRRCLTSALVEVAVRYGRRRPGQWRLIDLARRLGPPPSGLRKVCRNGLRWVLDPSFGNIDRAVYYSGCYEPETTGLVRRYCKRGDTVFDVGANIGYFSVLMADRVGPGGHVFAFEPSGRFYERLTKNVTVNGFSHVTAERIALSDDRSTMQVCVSHSTSSAAMRYSDGYQESVACTTLDDYVAERGIAGIDFMKIDVDGWEVHCLDGGRASLASHRPVLTVEVSPRNLAAADTTPDTLLYLLERLGYALFSENGAELGRHGVMRLLNAPGVRLVNVLCLAR